MNGIEETPETECSDPTEQSHSGQQCKNNINNEPTITPVPEEKENLENVPCRIPTINFGDFLSLLSPSNVEKCICCATSLLQSPPPSLFPERKTEILKSFCDILNLPFTNTNRNNSEEEETEEVDFPFCSHCTNHKIVLLTMAHKQLQVLQDKFEQMKDDIMKDILRVFVTSIVVEKKVGVEVIRESRLYQKMFNLLKRHSERRTRNNGIDSEAQTDIASISTPLLTPATVATMMEQNATGDTNNKRRKIAPRKSESQPVDKTWNRRTPKSHLGHKYKANVPSRNRQPNSPKKSFNNVIEELVVPLDTQMNGDTFPFFGEHGLFQDLVNNDTYIPGVDFSHCLNSNLKPILNGFPEQDFYNVLGLVDDMEVNGSVTVEVPMEGVVAKKSSPEKSPRNNNLDPNGRTRRSGSRYLMGTCEICNKTMLKSTIKSHIEQIHGDERPYECRGCDKRFARRDHYLSHEERHVINSKRLYFCHRCGDNELLTGKTAYVSHCVKIHEIEDDVIEYFHFCDAENCDNSYKVREDFLYHLKTHWPTGESHKCKVCEKTFALKKRLDVHENVAHRSNEPYYDCQFCHKGFDEESDFSRHILFHKVKMPEEHKHICEECGKSFETPSRLRRHKYVVHVRGGGRRKSSAGTIDPPEEESISMQDHNEPEEFVDKKKPVVFSCETCGKVYKTEKRLIKHELKHVSEEALAPEPEGEEEGEVSVADVVGELDPEDDDYVPSPSPPKRRKRRKMSSSKSKVLRSSKTCLYCPRKISHSQELRRHLINSHRDQHLTKKQTFCPVCFYVFNNQEELGEHCDQKHSKFKCHHCGKQCSSTIILKQHLERHDDNQPFQCDICDQRFSSTASLKKHITKSHRAKEKSESSDIEEEEEDLQELSSALSPANHLDLLNHDQDHFDTIDTMDIFQM